MNHNIPNLQIHVHKVDGSITAFAQNDTGEIKKLLGEFQPMQIFNRDRIAFMDNNSITSFPVSKITRIDLVSEQLHRLIFPAGIVDAVELAGAEFEALVRSPVMREQFRLTVTKDASIVTLLDIEMAGGQCLFLTMETQVERLQSEGWKTRRFAFTGSGLCFRMQTGGIAVLNLAHLTRLTFIPKPLQASADVWFAQRSPSLPAAKLNGNHVNIRKQNENEPEMERKHL
jgi:hypothetical protein